MSTGKRKESIDPDLIGVWRQRYHDLSVQLEKQPDGQWAWLWRVRRDILFYLLRQYGPDDWFPQQQKQLNETGPENTASEEPVSSYVQQSAGITAGAGAKYPPRGQSTFRSRLHHLRSINDRVRADFPVDMDPNAGLDPRARIVRKTYPGSPQAHENKRHNEILLEVFSRELEGIRSYLQENGHSVPEDAHLTEEEVLAILMGEVTDETDND